MAHVSITGPKYFTPEQKHQTEVAANSSASKINNFSVLSIYPVVIVTVLVWWHHHLRSHLKHKGMEGKPLPWLVYLSGCLCYFYHPKTSPPQLLPKTVMVRKTNCPKVLYLIPDVYVIFFWRRHHHWFHRNQHLIRRQFFPIHVSISVRSCYCSHLTTWSLPHP